MIGYGNSNDGSYVYMGVGSAGVQVFNVTDASNPSIHAFIRTNAVAKECEISGNYLYVSDRSSGIQIYDTKLLKTKASGPTTVVIIFGAIHQIGRII
ncbi:MAG: hypothetical protein CM15mP36_01720 [Flavobacteriales bacterium]|nr:MAG: hypothetical protein CM15mP36_01720 [Flavobacteriales bacterium]